MKIVIAPDSFKGSATALQAAQSIEAGEKQGMSHWAGLAADETGIRLHDLAGAWAELFARFSL